MRDSIARFCVTVMTVLVCVGPPLVAQSESAPLLHNFQGRLTNSVGSPVTTPVTVDFRMWQGGDANTAGSGTLVYHEQQLITPDSNGVFVHVIGSGTPVGGEVLEEADFITNGLPLYIELTIGADTLLPRTQILSTGYAIEASRLDGKSAQEIIGQSGGNAFANEAVRNEAGLDWLSPSQILVKAGTIGFSDAKVRENNSDLTWDFANGTGPLGLDAGSETASTWYYLFAVPDPTDDNLFTAVASLNPPTQIGGAGPSGYGVHRFLGSFLNDSAADIRQFYRADDHVFWRGNNDGWLVRVNQAQPSETVDQWTTIDASGAMPETGRAVMINGYYRAGGNAGFAFRVGPTPGQGGYFCTAAVSLATCDMEVPTENRSFAYFAELLGGRTNDPNQTTAFYYRGYVENLDEY